MLHEVTDTLVWTFNLIQNNYKQPDQPLWQLLGVHLHQYQISGDD
jgi:hypothetical protein